MHKLLLLRVMGRSMLCEIRVLLEMLLDRLVYRLRLFPTRGPRVHLCLDCRLLHHSADAVFAQAFRDFVFFLGQGCRGSSCRVRVSMHDFDSLCRSFGALARPLRVLLVLHIRCAGPGRSLGGLCSSGLVTL